MKFSTGLLLVSLQVSRVFRQERVKVIEGFGSFLRIRCFKFGEKTVRCQ